MGADKMHQKVDIVLCLLVVLWFNQDGCQQNAPRWVPTKCGRMSHSPCASGPTISPFWDVIWVVRAKIAVLMAKTSTRGRPNVPKP
jgi:hypothetical protein